MRGIPNAPLARLRPFSRPFLRGAAPVAEAAARVPKGRSWSEPLFFRHLVRRDGSPRSLRHSARREEKCLLAGAFRRSGARAPKGRSREGVPPRHSARREEKCLLARAFRRSGARAPKGRSQRSEGSPRFLSLARRSLTLAFGSVRDDMKTFGMTRKEKTSHKSARRLARALV